jgi:hypothetical protein
MASRGWKVLTSLGSGCTDGTCDLCYLLADFTSEKARQEAKSRWLTDKEYLAIVANPHRYTGLLAVDLGHLDAHAILTGQQGTKPRLFPIHLPSTGFFLGGGGGVIENALCICLLIADDVLFICNKNLRDALDLPTSDSQYVVVSRPS